MTLKPLTTLAFLGLACLLASGCASTQTKRKVDNPPVPLTPEERREAAIKDFEQRRSTLQYDAALSRWNLGDIKGCESMLVSLLERNPHDRQSRRLLADVCLERTDLAAAESHLRILLEQDADDAQSHHSLGLLLEEAGRREESLRHLDRAAELAPDNELYALSRDASRQQSKIARDSKPASR
ncbi:MAG: tetratricopeptide repeat protein [Pirellulaceae bacterium]